MTVRISSPQLQSGGLALLAPATRLLGMLRGLALHDAKHVEETRTRSDGCAPFDIHPSRFDVELQTLFMILRAATD